jgi:hypothetical protein
MEVTQEGIDFCIRLNKLNVDFVPNKRMYHVVLEHSHSNVSRA